MAKKILVLGGTGLLGSYAARHLQREGFLVRILARNIQKAQGMFDDRFEIVQGDANNRENVHKALEGCHGAHISLSEMADLQGTLNVASCVHDVGLKQISYVSGASVHDKHRWFPMVAHKLQAESAVRDTGIAYTIFCPTWFFEVANNNFIQGNRAIILGKHPRPYHWLAADDFGRMVAVAYQTESAQNKRFYIMGPEALLMEDVIKRMCERLHPHITSIMYMRLWLTSLIAHATGNTRLLEACRFMGYFHKIGIEAVGDPTEANAVLGKPTTTLEQWLSLQSAYTAKSEGVVNLKAPIRQS